MVMLRIWCDPKLEHCGQETVPGLGLVSIAEALTTEEDGKRVGVVSFRHEGDDIEADYSEAWTKLQEYVELRCFAELSHARIVASRIETEVPLGTECSWVLYAGPPPSKATMQLVGGCPHQSRRLDGVPDGVPVYVRSAITWFLKAVRSADPFDRTLFLWTAFESLAPDVRETDRCERCDDGEMLCSACGKGKKGHRVLEGLRRYAQGLPSASKQIINRLYSKRSAIVHGRANMDAETAKAHGWDSMRLMVIVMEALKRELAWEVGDPAIELRGQMANFIALRSACVFESEEQRTRLFHTTITPTKGGISAFPGGFAVEPRDWNPDSDADQYTMII